MEELRVFEEIVPMLGSSWWKRFSSPALLHLILSYWLRGIRVLYTHISSLRGFLTIHAISLRIHNVSSQQGLEPHHQTIQTSSHTCQRQSHSADSSTEDIDLGVKHPTAIQSMWLFMWYQEIEHYCWWKNPYTIWDIKNFVKQWDELPATNHCIQHWWKILCLSHKTWTFFWCCPCKFLTACELLNCHTQPTPLLGGFNPSEKY